MRLIKWIDENLEEVFLIILLVLIASVMLLQVFMRKIMNNSLSWPEEFCRYCYVWSVFFSLGYTIRKGNMLRLSIIMDHFPVIVGKIISLLTNIICLIIYIAFLANSLTVVILLKNIGQTSTAIRLPMYIVYLCTCIGFTFALIRTIQVLFNMIKMFNSAKEEKA